MSSFEMRKIINLLESIDATESMPDRAKSELSKAGFEMTVDVQAPPNKRFCIRGQIGDETVFLCFNFIGMSKSGAIIAYRSGIKPLTDDTWFKIDPAADSKKAFAIPFPNGRLPMEYGNAQEMLNLYNQNR